MGLLELVGFRGLGFRVWGLGARIEGLGVQGAGFRVEAGSQHPKLSAVTLSIKHEHHSA